MTKHALHVGRAFTPTEEIQDALILVEDGRIRSIAPRASASVPSHTRYTNASHLIAVPGFLDVHIHGAGGHDVMEATPDALEAVASTVARFGTTSFVATTVTASPDDTCSSLVAIARFIGRQAPATRSNSPQAEILGIHLEGPFISSARCGVHPLAWIAPPSLSLLTRFLDAADGHARILTLAPELPGALDLIGAARARGLIVGLGHTDATYEQSCTAIARGACHAVHVFNAMRPFNHRETGILGAALTEPSVTCELIADGVHVDPPAMRLLLNAKGIGGVLLVSDGISATGMPDGNYRLGTFEVAVTNGICRNSEGRLAGSTLTLDSALRNIVALGVPLANAIRLVTLNPARLLGIESRKGVLAPGADADVVLLTLELQVAGVMTHGAGSV